MKLAIIALFLVGCGLEPIKSADTDVDLESSTLQVGSLTVTPAAINFGQTLVGSPTSETLLFNNTSESSISISSAYLEGNEAFSLDSSLLSFDLEAGMEEIVTVHFNPSQLASVEGQLNILVESESAIGQVSLAGEGVSSIEDTGEEDSGTADSGSSGNSGLVLSKSSHNFGTINLNATATLAIDVTNESTNDIAIDNIVSSESVFALSSFSNLQSGDVISAGMTRTLNIGFTPVQETDYSGVFQVEDSNGEQLLINLNGTGSCSNCVPIISVQTGGDSADVMNQFNLVWSGIFPVPATESFTLTNLGTVPLDIQSITITNDSGSYASPFCNNAGEFSLAGSSAFTVPANGSSNVQVNLDYVGGISGSSVLCGENENYYLLNPSDLQNTIRITSNDPVSPVSLFRLGGTITVLQ